MKIRLEFIRNDLWIGVFWTTIDAEHEHGWSWDRQYNVWICLLPMLPIHISWSKHVHVMGL